jgi:hypothetical protein
MPEALSRRRASRVSEVDTWRTCRYTSCGRAIPPLIAFHEGGLALGTYTGGIADPQIVEIIGHAGFDAAFIDMEHTSFDLRDVQLMVMAAERVGINKSLHAQVAEARAQLA